MLPSSDTIQAHVVVWFSLSLSLSFSLSLSLCLLITISSWQQRNKNSQDTQWVFPFWHLAGLTLKYGTTIYCLTESHRVHWCRRIFLYFNVQHWALSLLASDLFSSPVPINHNLIIDQTWPIQAAQYVPPCPSHNLGYCLPCLPWLWWLW